MNEINLTHDIISMPSKIDLPSIKSLMKVFNNKKFNTFENIEEIRGFLKILDAELYLGVRFMEMKNPDDDEKIDFNLITYQSFLNTLQGYIPNFNNYKYAGPGNDLGKAIIEDIRPYNLIDDAARIHDLLYTLIGTLKDADKRKILKKESDDSLEEILKSESIHGDYKLDAEAGIALISTQKIDVLDYSPDSQQITLGDMKVKLSKLLIIVKNVKYKNVKGFELLENIPSDMSVDSIKDTINNHYKILNNVILNINRANKDTLFRLENRRNPIYNYANPHYDELLKVVISYVKTLDTYNKNEVDEVNDKVINYENILYNMMHRGVHIPTEKEKHDTPEINKIFYDKFGPTITILNLNPKLLPDYPDFLTELRQYVGAYGELLYQDHIDRIKELETKIDDKIFSKSEKEEEDEDTNKFNNTIHNYLNERKDADTKAHKIAILLLKYKNLHITPSNARDILDLQTATGINILPREEEEEEEEEKKEEVAEATRPKARTRPKACTTPKGRTTPVLTPDEIAHLKTVNENKSVPLIPPTIEGVTGTTKVGGDGGGGKDELPEIMKPLGELTNRGIYFPNIPFVGQRNLALGIKKGGADDVILTPEEQVQTENFYRDFCLVMPGYGNGNQPDFKGKLQKVNNRLLEAAVLNDKLRFSQGLFQPAEMNMHVFPETAKTKKTYGASMFQTEGQKQEFFTTNDGKFHGGPLMGSVEPGTQHINMTEDRYSKDTRLYYPDKVLFNNTHMMRI